MSTLPSSWISLRLGTVVTFNYGKALPESSRTGTGFPVFGSNGVVGKHASPLTSGPAIVIGRKGSVGAVHFATEPCCPIDTTYFVSQVPGGQLRYWYHLLRSLELASLNKSTAIPGLSREDAYRLEVPIAPLAEQQRIADKLDTVLTRVDAVSARLARVAPLLKRFRQSVLAAATSGRLTEGWREANPSASSWNDCQIGDLLREKPRNGYSPKAVGHETPVRSLTLSATTTGRFRPECFKFVPDDIPLDSHLWIAKDDVLIQRANSLEYVGVSAVVDVELGGYIYPDLMMKCRANERTSSAFLNLLLSSADIRKHFREHATGTAGNMPKINQQTVISAPCRVPAIKEQAEIVRRVETLFAFADRLEARLKSAQAAAGRLTPALLAKAFRGELVPQDPDDEPASELLRRLQAASDHRAPARAAGRGRKRSI